ncbi:alpha/beta-hydrolase [Schizopora paradoxa]|uniref:Alpha/beta-hydrolase n=1 Tax=Schizopora paradoxa TaxID=27342 RepID=A0A0H2SRN0_9AGAM|nr:alpha/beta-hydrolase [Schizopora paradoxa]
MFTVSTTVFPTPGSDLVYAANEYTPRGAEFVEDGFTLLFTHNLSSCKEMWEPVMSELCALCSFEKESEVSIREMWSIEWQSHGESALLNEGKNTVYNCRVRDYADAITGFVSNVVRDEHKFVIVGYSAGAIAWGIASLKLSTLPFAAVIFFEPPFVVPPIQENDPRVAIGIHNTKVVLTRKEYWNSILEARTYLRSRIPWNSWNQTMFDVVLSHTLRTTKLADGTEIVTTCCSNVMEQPAYGAEDYIAASPALNKLCASVPVHIVFGESTDLISNASRAAMCDEQQGRRMKSVQIIPYTGHLVVHENPLEAAKSIIKILRETAAALKRKPKL